MTDDGTLLGTFVNEIMTPDGDEAMVIYSVLGNLETNENGTTTTELEYHDDGMTTVAGT
jgi:hypothetical protein